VFYDILSEYKHVEQNVTDVYKCLLGPELISCLVTADLYVHHDLYYCLEVTQSLIMHKDKRQAAKAYGTSISLWHVLESDSPTFPRMPSPRRHFRARQLRVKYIYEKQELYTSKEKITHK